MNKTKKELMGDIDDLMRIIAHRGLSKYYPENTLIAYKKAYEKGIKYVECDISFTKDDIPVLLHDNKVDRTSNKKGKINKYSLEELKKLDFGSWLNISFKDERIPTLEEFLELCKELELIPYIEIKPIKNKKLIIKYCKIIIDIVNKIDYHNIVFISLVSIVMFNSLTEFIGEFARPYILESSTALMVDDICHMLYFVFHSLIAPVFLIYVL